MAGPDEIDEHVHHARDPFDKVVAGTMAIIAALLAIVSVLGLHFISEKLLNQQFNSDQWSYYQAKNIRRYMAQVARDLLTQTNAGSEMIGRYTKDIARYDDDMKTIQEKAREYEKERDVDGRRAESFHIGEVFLEVGIVLSSLAILTKRKLWYSAGIGSAVVGVLAAASAFVHV
jgi:Domain of unknown function (DUF4337)